MAGAVVEIDGAEGEGGGQVLRTCLSLSLVTGRPFVIHDVRGKRKKPGLLRQHLAAVRAAVAVGDAIVRGDVLGSSELAFEPRSIAAGEYHGAIGSAGSTTLVLETVLWPLLVARGRSRLVLEGGTHNPLAPPFEFIERALVPRLRTLGAAVTLELVQPGFAPAGGGRIEVEIDGSRPLAPASWLERGAFRGRRAVAVVSGLADSIARRELEVLHTRLGWPRACLAVERVESAGPGNFVQVELEHESGTTVLTSFGAKGVRAEQVASDLAADTERFIAAKVPIDDHLADQLLLPLALAGGGSFRTTPPTLHTRTNAALIARWLPVTIAFTDDGDRSTRVDVHPRGRT